jgi:methylenetetrahydrofolate--tRNA-(uracil-5-)-methyltransferase
VGGGLAGPEAAYQAARAGARVRLYEMRPRVFTPAHKTAALGELVCSNSLKSEALHSAPWLLKQELRDSGSLLLRCAAACAVPGGQSLTVDRVLFSAAIEAALEAQPDIEIVRCEITELPPAAPANNVAAGAPASHLGMDVATIVATGPLTSGSLSARLRALTGEEAMYFYDAISPIIEADSIDLSRVFAASRYGRGGDDYLNCPFTREEFETFVNALLTAESYPLHAFEQSRFFEACLPIEELVRRGAQTLRFGPMKPVGLPDPRTGRLPYAVVQLRRENLRAGSYNLVGFQNHLRFGEQARVLRLIPGLENARFVRYGQVHRNTYLDAPAVLTPALAIRNHPSVYIAGQLCGTEGYVEAIATGFIAGVFAARRLLGQAPPPLPRASALGSLVNYITGAARPYVPANMTFDLLPPLPPEEQTRDRPTRHRRQCERALAALADWRARIGLACPSAPAPALEKRRAVGGGTRNVTSEASVTPAPADAAW